MRQAAVVLGAVGSLAVATPAASEPRPARSLEPSSTWVLDYADERCSLLRSFGSGDDSVSLQIDSFGSWNEFRVTVSGKAVPRSKKPAGTGGFRLTGDPEDREAPLLQGTLGETRVPAVSFGMGFIPYGDEERLAKATGEEQWRLKFEILKPRPEFERTVDTIRVIFDRGAPIDLHVGSMADPLAAMRTCIDDLYRSWGIDPVAQKALSRPAKPLPSTVKHVQREYPGGALLSGTSAFVPVRLTVGANGRADSCVVQSTAPDKAFRAAVCDNLASKFEPALDGQGKAVASLWHTSVIYLIPDY